MKQKYLSIIMMFSSSIVFSSEEDLFKRLEKEVATVTLDCDGIQRYKNFMDQMHDVMPDDNGYREFGYTEQKVKPKRVRSCIDGVEHVFVQHETFSVFKGFRVSKLGSVCISKNLDIEQFDERSPAIAFLACIAEVFAQNFGRIEIPLEEGVVVKFWQPRSKRLILGCAYDENGLPKPLQ